MSDDELNNLENELYGGNIYKPNNTEKAKSKMQPDLKKVDTFERMLQEMEDEGRKITQETDLKVIKHPKEINEINFDEKIKEEQKKLQNVLSNINNNVINYNGKDLNASINEDDEAEKILKESMKTSEVNKLKNDQNKVNKSQIVKENTLKNGNKDVLIQENGKIDEERNKFLSTNKENEKIEENKIKIEEDIYPENLESKY